MREEINALKRLTCEMCGSTDLVKQDGVFVCQSCGCKYSVEEAKKLMIEGVVDVSGSTVKVDDSEELSNLYELARRAKKSHNAEDIIKYYEKILLKDPRSWEASFYTVYIKAQDCEAVDVKSAANSLSGCLPTVVTLIKDYVKESDDQLSALTEISNCSHKAFDILYTKAKEYYDEIMASTKYKKDNASMDLRCETDENYPYTCRAVFDILYVLGDQIDEQFGSTYKDLSMSAWKTAAETHDSYEQTHFYKEEEKQKVLSYKQKLGKYDVESKRQAIREELQHIYFLIRTTPVESKLGVNLSPEMKLLNIALGIIGILGIIVALCALISGSNNDGELGLLLLCLFLVIFSWSMLQPPKPEVIAANKVKLASLLKQRDELEKTLKSLEKSTKPLD